MTPKKPNNNLLCKFCIMGSSLLAIVAATGCQSTDSFTMPTFAMPALHVPTITVPTIPVPNMQMPSMQAINPMNLFNKDKQAKKKTPNRMAVIWNDASLSDVGKPTTRGFGGRVYFYDENNDPVKVDGEMVVYGFEDGENEHATAADRKYVFEQKDLEKHFSESEIGPSYSFWVPWDRAGGMRETVALLPVFKDASGKVIQGGHSLNVLNGKAPPEQTVARTDVHNSDYTHSRVPAGERHSNFAGAQVSHLEDAGQPANRIRSSTIRVPRSLAQRMRNASAMEAANLHAEVLATQSLQHQPSPLIQQLQAKNNLGAGQSVTYGNQVAKEREFVSDDSKTQTQSATATTQSRVVSPFTRDREARAVGRPGSYK